MGIFLTPTIESTARLESRRFIRWVDRLGHEVRTRMEQYDRGEALLGSGTKQSADITCRLPVSGQLKAGVEGLIFLKIVPHSCGV